MTTAERIVELKAIHEKQIAEVNDLFRNGTGAEVEAKLAELAETEKKYRIVFEGNTYDHLGSVKEVLELYEFEVLSHKKITKDGQVTGIEGTTKKVQVDLKAFCEQKGLPLDWYYEVQALNKRLTLRAAINLKASRAEIREIDSSYKMEKLAEEIELGKTPESTTQCVKHMQKVFDMLCPESGKVLACDLEAVMLTYGKFSKKEELTVVCKNHNRLMETLTTVFNKVVTGKSWHVGYKRTKTATDTQDQAEKVAAKKAAARQKTTKKAAPKAAPAKKETEVVAKRAA